MWAGKQQNFSPQFPALYDGSYSVESSPTGYTHNFGGVNQKTEREAELHTTVMSVVKNG